MANVNRPTDTAIKERDINNKLQLYGIFQAFSNGKVPSNKQIDIAMNSALSSTPLSSPSKKLSQEGHELIADLRDVISQAKYLLLTKNQGNLLQDFIWQTQNLDGGNASLPNAPTDKATAKQHGNEALDGLRTLGTLIISNGQFRKLLNDALVLLRDIAGDAAQKTADKVNPSEGQLNQIDEPAEDDTWHETPDMSRGNVKGQLQKIKPFSRGDVQEAAEKGANTAQDHPSDNPQSSGRAGLSHAADHLKQTASQNIPDEHQDRARERLDQAQQTKENTKHDTKQYMKKKMPQERRDQTIYRLKKMVVEIQGHEDYQEAIDTLLGLAETYGGHAKNVAQQSRGATKDVHDDNSLQRAEYDLKTLIERFANHTSTDDLFEAINNIYRDADQDPELKKWFQSVDKYIRRCLQEQGYILRDSSTDEYNKLYDHGEYLLRDRYRDHTDRIVDEFSFLAEQFDKDPQNQAFAQSCQKLFQDLGTDENGKPTFKPHLVKDLFNVIIPGIFENTRYVPIPRIEVSDPQIDAIVENLVIESDNLFPNMVEFGNDNYFRLGRRQNSSSSQQKIMLSASGIQMDLKDVAYYVKRKEGFPSLTDKGVMDIILAGEGFSFKLAARTALEKDRTHFVAVDNVTVQVKNLDIKLKQSNHKLLFGIFKPLLLKVMRPVIQKVIEKQIKKQFEELDGFAWSIYQDVQKGIEAAKKDPDNAQGIFQQYATAFQKKLIANKEKAKAKGSNVKVNVAMTQHDSIFKNIKLPGGISTKATEYKNLAAKGDKWESPIFAIGGARESSDIPKAQEVRRKPHNAASGTVRGGNHPNAVENRSTGYDRSNYGQNPYSSGTNGNYNTNPSSTAYNTNPPSTAYNTNSSSTTYNTNPSSTATSGFSNQVDRAFHMNKNQTGGANQMTNGSSNLGRTNYYDATTA